MNLYTVISRFSVGPSGKNLPTWDDLQALPDDAAPELIEWREAFRAVGAHVFKNANALYFSRMADSEGNVITLSCYTDETTYKAMYVGFEEEFARMKAARTALATHLGLTIEVKEMTVDFDALTAADSFEGINNLFENTSDDLVHSRGIATPEA